MTAPVRHLLSLLLTAMTIAVLLACGERESCEVVASAYDQSCRTSSDCVAVPAGGNVCNPCGASAGAFFCPLAAVNVSVSGQYATTLSNALDRLQGSPDWPQCGATNCPMSPPAACQNGVCVVPE